MNHAQQPSIAHQPPNRAPKIRLAATSRNVWKSLYRQAPYALQRLTFSGLVILFIIFFSYLGLNMAGGEEVEPAARQAFSNSIAYLGRALHGELGLSFAGTSRLRPVPVSQVIAERLPRSLGLLGASLAFASITGVALGMVAARNRTRYSQGILLSTVIGVSFPSFFTAFLLQMAVITLTRIAGRSLLPVGGFGWDNHLILPMFVLAAQPVAQITRITFGAIRRTRSQDFVRTARGKGLHNLVILTTHILRNAAIPIITTIGLSLRFSLSSLPVVEFYFGWPGIGTTLLKAISQRDDNLTIALALCLGLLFLFINFSLELIYRAVDPRLAEAPRRFGRGQGMSLSDRLGGLWEGMRRLAGDLATLRWFRSSPMPFLWDMNGDSPLARLTDDMEGHQEAESRRKRAARRSVSRNVPFLLGLFLVAGVIGVVVFGPQLAPNNPFHTQGIVLVDGTIATPPFPPSKQYPWGTDALGRGIMSLILSGAQQTVMLAVLVVAARTFVGVSLGSIAGWTRGGMLDRVIQSIAEIISAFPTLLLAMILILALGIRNGMAPFIIALCFVGWGGIMQYVRGEVISLKPRPFLESAIAVGASTFRTINRHILPNLYSGLISIVSLEMSAVLMLLGELGFISIFIGGGTFIDLPSGVLLYSDLPEWGALLSDLRYQARSYPWTALYPMLAFFISILGFNLLGEGMRRLVDEGALILNRLVNRYTIALILLTVIGLNWLRGNSGALPFYRQQAHMFDGYKAMGLVQDLVAEDMEGRALGTTGMDLGADYIAAAFDSLGLQPAGEKGTYFQQRSHSFGRLDAVPIFGIKDGGFEPIFREDFAPFPGRNISDGEAHAPVRFVGLGRPSSVEQPIGRTPYPDLDRADYSGEVVLVLTAREANLMSWVPKEGLLVVTDDQAALAQQQTLPGRSGKRLDINTGERSGDETPYLWISETLANRLLGPSGHSVDSLRNLTSDLPVEALYELPLETEVQLDVQATLIPEWPVRHVLGFLPGTYDYEFCTDCLARKLIVVMAQYDSPPPGPLTSDYTAANDNASGVSVMLEAIRTLQETEYQPFKSLLFIAFSGEGLDGGSQVSNPDVHRFLQAKPGFAQTFELEAVIELRGVGGGPGNSLEISSGGSLRLAELFERTGHQMGVRMIRSEEPLDLSVIYQDSVSQSESGLEAPRVRLHWEGWETLSHMPGDTIRQVSPIKLEGSGRTLAFSLMVMGRETNY